MKELKFRAWDSEDEEMIDVNEIDFKHKFIRSSSWHHPLDIDEIVLMQYIGVKDKNDVEVYEGDIITCTGGCPHEVIFKLEHGGNILGGMPTFYLSGLSSGYQWFGGEEVIGNIYENKELLETKKD